MILLFVAFGGAVGSVLRYLTTSFAIQHISATFPYGTLIVNVIGSLLLGICMGWVESSTSISQYWRPLIAIGFLGGFTTFSTFSFDSFTLFLNGDYLKALLNILLNFSLGLIAVGFGYFLLKS